MHLKQKPKRREPIIHNKDELSLFLQKHGIHVVQKGSDFRFLLADSKLVEPHEFFVSLIRDINKKIQDNSETQMVLRPVRGEGGIRFATARDYTNANVPIDEGLHKSLIEQKNEIYDYMASWKDFAKYIIFKVSEIPKEIRFSLPKQENKTESEEEFRSIKKLRLSKVDKDSLNSMIVKVVEDYLDKGNSQEEAFKLASINSAIHFSKWLTISKLDILSKGTIEGRYKRNKEE